MPGKRACRSTEEIINRIAEALPNYSKDYLSTLTRNHLVKEGHLKRVLNDEETKASLVYDNHVVKSYLGTFLENPEHRRIIREYVILCNKLQQRAYFTLKTAYFACYSGQQQC